MERRKKEKLWEDLRDYQEELIVKRFMSTIENCLVDLGVAASQEDLLQIRLLSHNLVKTSFVSRGIRNSCREIWDTIYAEHYGTAPQDDKTAHISV